MNQVTKTIQDVIDMTWPMILISIVIIVSLRITYLIKNHKHLILYKELFMLSFIIYILCLFQVVTFQDDVTWSSNNFIPFREIFRYRLGSRLFLKNVLGNVLLFMPFGFFASYYLNVKKSYSIIILTMIASISIESVQMSIGRVFDVDDILLNICGGILGYVVYYFLKKLTNKLPEFMKNEMFLNVISIIILLGVICLI
ncbi:MAG: VanZ family protein [Bacilli bacterium]|nr:VanZ family protein [Bacilli bacterium]